MDIVNDLLLNYYFLTFAFAWILSIAMKALWHSWKDRKRFHLKDGIQNGGMPSSHTAVVSSLTASLFFSTGLSDLFFVAAIFSSIVISDAIRVRKNVGLQGEKLNELLKKFDEKTIKVVYGHSFTQVMAGLLLGVLCAFIFSLILF
ncbi:MAG: divergent PAP2 family protein [Candidatus Woesearchaeota archaeon]